MPSSVIRSMTYNTRTHELLVRFRGGRGAYRYFDVPMKEWKAFRASASKGTYLNTTFKAHAYRYEKLVMQDEECHSSEHNQREHETDRLQWPLPEASYGSRAHKSEADDLDGLPRRHEAAPASLRRSVSS